MRKISLSSILLTSYLYYTGLAQEVDGLIQTANEDSTDPKARTWMLHSRKLAHDVKCAAEESMKCQNEATTCTKDAATRPDPETAAKQCAEKAKKCAEEAAKKCKGGSSLLSASVVGVLGAIVLFTTA